MAVAAFAEEQMEIFGRTVMRCRVCEGVGGAGLDNQPIMMQSAGLPTKSEASLTISPFLFEPQEPATETELCLAPKLMTKCAATHLVCRRVVKGLLDGSKERKNGLQRQKIADLIYLVFWLSPSYPAFFQHMIKDITMRAEENKTRKF